MSSAAGPSLRALLETAVAAHRSGDFTTAETHYRAVLAKESHQPDALHLLGLIHYQRGDHDGAIDLITQARGFQPRNGEMAYNLGRVQLDVGRWHDAIESNRSAVRLTPKMAMAHCNLGIALTRAGSAAEGETALRKAVALEPSSAAAWSALGMALHDQNKIDDACAAWNKALSLDPALAEARFNLATVSLATMDFDRGWPLFAARSGADPLSFQRGGGAMVNAPPWRGEDLTGKTILVWGEQGLGDQILFAGLIPELCARAGRVVIACTPRLVALFARSFPNAMVLAQGDSALHDITIDLQAPLGDLAPALRPSASSFKPHNGYLSADPARAETLRKRMQGWTNGSGPLIGISWHSHRATIGGAKSIPLPAWENVLRVPGTTFVSLQYGAVEADVAAVGRDDVMVHRDPDVDATHDIDGLAAQMAALDLVITVSNTTAHLAGALNVPVWTMAPVGGGSLWWWFITQGSAWRDSPWYPAMRVYHQATPGDWAPVLDAVAKDLATVCAAPPPHR